MAKIVDRDRGYKKLRTKFRRASGKHGVYVGFDKNVIHEGAGFPMATLAAVHEFGSPSAGIPERSHFRVAFDVNKTQYEKYVLEASKEFTDPNGTPFMTALAFLGEQYADSVREQIAKGIAPSLAPSTLKGRTDMQNPPLMDTGEYVDKIDAVIRMGWERGP